MDGLTSVRTKDNSSKATLGSGNRNKVDDKPTTKTDAKEELLRDLNAWWEEARQYHAANRVAQLNDADFYDHHQFDEHTAREMLNRGQFPSVYNLIALAIDWIIGTERRTRVEGKVHPRGPQDVKGAEAKQQTLKYIDDVNQASFERSAAFAASAKVGVGWLEEAVVKNPRSEPISVAYQDWKEMWWDPFAKKPDLSDARYIHRRRWVDLDYAIAMFPDHAEALRATARSFTEMDVAESDDLADIPAMFLNRDVTRTMDTGYSIYGTTSINLNYRRRLPLTETWYKKPVQVKRLQSVDMSLNGQDFDEGNPDHNNAVAGGWASITDAVAEDICLAIWIPRHLLSQEESPYKHKRYPFTPIWCKREDRTGMPYGYVRGMKDAQMDYNKRRGKALYLLSVNRTIVEKGAIDAADEDEFKDEVAAPDAFLRVNKNALKDKRIEIQWGADLAESQLKMMELGKEHILEGSGVTRENLGQDTGDQSGRAIGLKQTQGSVTTAELFDNYRQFMQTSNQKTVSNIEQFMTLPKQLRIIGSDGRMDWLTVNEPDVGPNGEIFFHNDLAKQEADYVIDQQDYRETVRMAMAQQTADMVAKLPPEYQLSFFDLVVELMDIPNRDAFVARFRQLSGMPPPGQEGSPEAMAAQQAKADQAQQERNLQAQERGAKIQQHLAAASKLQAEAKRLGVLGKKDALDTAGLVHAALPLAPAADRLYAAPTPPES